MTRIKDLSTNPFEFIRQCTRDHLFSTKQGMIDQSWMHGAEFAGRVIHLLSKEGTADMIFLQGQRQMVRDLATEMLGKVLYTQEQFAGKLIALMNEFGVGVAFVEKDLHILDPSVVNHYTVVSYTPGAWGKREDFQDESAALQAAEDINNFGNFVS